MIDLEYLRYRLRRRFTMGPFVAHSNDLLDAAIESAVAGLPRTARVGIFGMGDMATRCERTLRRRGFEDIFFVASSPFKEYHRARDLFDIKSPVALRADYFLVASLARPQELADELVTRGFQGGIVTLPAMKHLSTMLSRDTSTPARIRDLAGRHAGQPGFVVGTAPSLKITHPERIGGRAVTFGGNGVIRIGGFVPDYYFFLDANALRSWGGEIGELDTTVMLASHLVSLYKEYPGLRARRNVLFPACYERDDDIDVDLWEQKGFETGHTVVCPMLQFALLMGCNPIYLIGVDLTYGTRGSYFTERYHAAGVPAYQADKVDGYRTRMLEGIRRSVEAARRRGVAVYNCSPNRNLPFMENRDYDEVTEALLTRAG